MFAFPKTVDSLDDVPEIFRVLYDDTDGRCLLNSQLAAKLDEGIIARQQAVDAQQTIASRNEEVVRLRNTLEHYLVDATARSELAAQKAFVELLLPHVRAVLKVQEADGLFEVQVVDDHGQPREGVSIADLVAEMRRSESLGRAFEGGQTTNRTVTPTALSQQEARDPAKYRAAREEAIRTGRILLSCPNDRRLQRAWSLGPVAGSTKTRGFR